MPADYLDQLAEFVTSTRLENLDISTVEAAKNVLLDTIGAILAGSRLPENAGLARLARELGGAGPATLLGHSDQAQPLFAALVNAAAGVSLEMDEVGYEVTSRIGTGTQARTEVHSHGTWGTIGAAATARLMGFDAAQTRQTMNLAMSMSPANTWTPCLEGATIRNLYPGRSSFQGILAAHLCRCGFTGVQDGPADLYTSILGEGFDPEAVVDGLGQPGPLRIQQNYFKLHACCLYNHPALDAVQALLRQERFTAAEVARIQVVAPPIAAIMTNPEPENMLAAKFSIPYAVAVAIARGATDVSAFYPDRVADSQIRELAHHVKVVADPAMNLRRYDYPAAKIAVTLKDGRTFQKRRYRPIWRRPQSHIP
jgi:2-methylcitrate dehydratase PrpD